MALIFQIVKCR